MLKKWPLELITWTGGIIFLGVTYPHSENHFSLCPIQAIGFTGCPGCGMGRSISYLLHGELGLSFNQHWFGVPGLGILILRIVQLFKKFLLNLMSTKALYYGK